MQIIFRRLCLTFAMLFCAGLDARLSTAFAQGALTPPGAPAPTMKSLDQVEPRTAITNTASLAAITQPGSYYLTRNISVSSGNAIEIDTNDVTLDLNGFTLLGLPGAEDGVLIGNGCTNVVVRNGIISSWGGNGVEIHGNNVLLDHLIIAGSFFGVNAITCNGGVIRDCTVSGSPVLGIELNSCNSFLLIGNNCIGDNTMNSSIFAAISVSGNYNRIEGNHIAASGSAGFGLQVTGSSNLVIKNSVEGGSANNYSVNASQVAGPIIANTVSGVITNLNPWANFSF